VSPTTASPTTGQAGDDDVEETSDGTDDGLQDGGNAVDDGHEAGTDGAEDAFNLPDLLLATEMSCRTERGELTHETTAPILKLLRCATDCVFGRRLSLGVDCSR
jgi:hypothetical protein